MSIRGCALGKVFKIWRLGVATKEKEFKKMERGPKGRIILIAFVTFLLLPYAAYGQPVALPPVNLGETSFLDGDVGLLNMRFNE